MYHIVCFPSSDDEDEVEVIHDSWLLPDKKRCYFPPYLKGQLKKALISKMEPRDSWTIYNMRILKSYDTYDKAVSMLSIAEETSNLESDVPLQKTFQQQKRKALKRRNKKEIESESDEEHEKSKKRKSNLPLPPTINLDFENELESTDISELNRLIEIRQSQYVPAQDCTRNLDVAPTPFERRVIKWMEKTDRVLESHTEKLNSILRLLSSQEARRDPINVDDDIPKFPMNSKEDMDKFECYLKDSANFNKMVHYFACKGGDNAENSTKRILKAILAPELLSLYNWAGRGEKTAFKDSATKRLIIYAVRKNFSGAVNEKNMEEVMKSVLKYAPLRVKYKESKV